MSTSEPVHAADRPRACVRCYCVKDARGFPERGTPRVEHRRRLDLSYRGISRVCWSCVEAEAWALHAAAFHPRPMRDFKRGRVVYRTCVECKVAKPLTRDFYASGRARYQTCRDCMRAKRTAYNRERMKSRERKDALNARLKEKRANDPEYRRKANEATARWRAKQAADPAWRAEQREKARIEHRLKREREGVPIDDVRKVAKVGRRGDDDFLPVGPLLALVERVIEQREVIAEAIDEPGFGRVATVCRDLGIDERKFRAWRAGEFDRVLIGTAEAVMLAANVDVAEVYSPDDYPEVLARFSDAEVSS